MFEVQQSATQNYMRQNDEIDDVPNQIGETKHDEKNCIKTDDEMLGAS